VYSTARMQWTSPSISRPTADDDKTHRHTRDNGRLWCLRIACGIEWTSSLAWKNVKSFPSLPFPSTRAHLSALSSVSVAVSQTPAACCRTTDIRDGASASRPDRESNWRPFDRDFDVQLVIDAATRLALLALEGRHIYRVRWRHRLYIVTTRSPCCGYNLAWWLCGVKRRRYVELFT